MSLVKVGVHLLDSSVGNVITYDAGGWGSIPSEVLSLITMSIMAL
jgi:hypothetical protein